MNRGNEWRPTNGETLARELKRPIEWTRGPEKYRGLVRLREMEFEIDGHRAEEAGISFPLPGIEEVEAFVEFDGRTTVLVFYARPVGYSGFMDCVTRSLALTDRGLF